MDKARKKTDKILRMVERGINRLYSNDPSLNNALKNYRKYMNSAEKKLAKTYAEYKNADPEEKDLKKKAYTDKLIDVFESLEYKSIEKDLINALTQVNQMALETINEEMVDIYVLNYNQVANDCRKVGIPVHGE